MYPCSTSNLKLPEWYTVERKAEKSINNLNTLKELDYYLKHPDDRLRRLAILRLNKLNLRDSFNYLKEILDEPMETQSNKELAAWSIKSIATSLDADLFISHRLLTHYTGNERYSDLFNFTVDEKAPAPAFSFSAMPDKYQIKLQNTDMLVVRSNLPNMNFDFKNWLSLCTKNILCSMDKKLKSLILKTIEHAKKAVITIPSIPKKLFKEKTHEKKVKNSKPIQTTVKSKPISVYSPHRFRPGLLFKKALFEILYILLFPVRIILKLIKSLFRHKTAVLAGIAVLYCVLSLTSIGRVTTLKYLGIDLRSFNTAVIDNSKKVSSFVLSEFKGILDIESTKPHKPQVEMSNTSNTVDTPKRIFTVVAQKGLNIRVAPSSSSAKAGDILGNGIQVTYLGKTEKDTGGRLWYFVMTPGGINGWVYSGGLKEKESVNQ